MQAVQKSRQSSFIIKEGILQFYEDNKIWPRGLNSRMECIQDWALMMGDAIKRLAAQLKRSEVVTRRCYSYSLLDHRCSRFT